jgi:4-hydroxybenzoate polyprenyltransferase
MTLVERLTEYEKLTRLDRPIGILLLAWPTLWGLWMSGNGRPDWIIFWIFALGVVLTRSAGCVVNDYADRHFDPHVERTRNRPLATGRVSEKESLWLAAGLAFMALLLILPLRNLLLIELAVVAALLAATYPFTKRFFAIPQAYLGVCFGFGIPMAYAAHLGTVPPIAWLLLTANVFWSIAYDTEYAMVDRPDDLKIGIKTSAITFGRYEVTVVMLSYGINLALLGVAGWDQGLGLPYAAGLLAAAGIAGYHYVLIRGREPARCFKAFLHNNWYGGAVFAGMVADYLLGHPRPW